MRWLKAVVMALVIGVLVVPALKAGPVNPVDVASLIDHANIIVIGQVMRANTHVMMKSEESLNPFSPRRYAVSFRAVTVLKGNLKIAPLKGNYTITASPHGDIPDAQYGIFFLRREEGTIVPVEASHPFLPAVQYGADGEGDALGQITAILREVLISPTTGTESRQSALDALARLNTTGARDALREAMNQAQGGQRLLIASKLVARDDIAGLEAVKAALLDPRMLPQSLFLNLAGSLAGLRDPRSIPSLGMLVKANSVEIRRNAAAALRQIRSTEGLQPLAWLLNDNDIYVRYYAVSGMGEATGQDEWTPSFDEFQEHEDYYLSHWRNWAEVDMH